MGAISAALVQKDSKLIDYIGELSIGFSLIVNTWFAGWVYLNLELWSYRFYFSYFEKKIGITHNDSSDLISFYKTNLFGMYEYKFYDKYPAHYVLDIVFILPLVIVYLFAISIGLIKGFDRIQEIYPGILTNMVFPICYVLLTFTLIISAFVVKVKVQRKQKEYWVNLSMGSDSIDHIASQSDRD